MYGWWYPKFKNLKELWNKHVFSYFLCGFNIKTSVYAWTCYEQPRTCEEQLRTLKHIQRNLNDCYRALILNYHHDSTRQVREMDYTSCKIYMVEVETLGRGPKGGGKEDLGGEEWILLNTLSLRKTKIWQDYSTS